MKHWVLGLIFAVLAGWAVAQDVPHDAEIEGVIQNQIEAFQSDDVAGAFAFASPTIQRLFRSPENFGRMVQHGFPMVWRPRDVEFHDQRVLGGTIWQRVQITDGKGREFWLAYDMIRVDDTWRINGVHFIDAPSVSA